MRTSFISVCLGCNSTIVAMNKHPEEFQHVHSMIALQPVSVRAIVERTSENAGIENGAEIFDQAIFKRTGFHTDDLTPLPYAHSVTVPTLMAQVRAKTA